MEYLGYDRRKNAVYEGEPFNGYRVMPPPQLTPIQFTKGGPLPQISRGHDALPQLLFREDDFDPVTKIRRGRVFQASEENQPQAWHVVDSLYTQRSPSGVTVHQLSTYIRSTLADLKNPNQTIVILGQDSHLTFWKIISIECNLVGTPVMLIKALQTYNDLPTIKTDPQGSPIEKDLKDSIEKVESSINRQSPTEVVDRCRDTLSIAFGHKAGDRSKDLSEGIKGYLNLVNPQGAHNDNLCSHCGKIVARLHARGKPNEQHGRSLPSLTEHDADLAINCLKIVLRELGYAT